MAELNINEIVKAIENKLKADPGLIEKAKKDPAGAIKAATGLEISPKQLADAAKQLEGKVDLAQVGEFLKNLKL